MDPDLYPRFETENYLEGSLPFEAEHFPQKRAVKAALLSAGLLTVIALVTTAGAWFLRLRVSGSIMDVYAPACLALLLFALFSAFWAMSAKRKATAEQLPNALLSLIVFIGGLTLGAFFIVGAAGLLAARCTHSAALFAAQSGAVKAGFLSKMGSRIDGIIFTALSALSVVATSCLAFLVFAAFSFMRNRLQTTKLALLVALPLSAVFALLAAIVFLRNQSLLATLAAQFPAWTSATCLVVVLLVAVAVFALLNALGSLLRSEVLHFIFGFMWVVIGLSLVLGGGVLLRDVRRSNCGNGLSCRAAAEAVHADRYVKMCPAGKYLGAGQTCRKVDLVTQWETGTAPAFLNPRCCPVATSIATQPLLCLALCLLAAAVFGGIAVGANFAQTDLAEEDRTDARRFSLVDVLTLLAVCLAVGSLALVCIRTARTQQSLTHPQIAKTMPAAVMPTSEAPSLCYLLSQGNIPVLACKSGKGCQFTVGLLVLSGSFETEIVSSPASERSRFFADGGDANSDFRLLRGSPDVLNGQLSALRVCQTNPAMPHAVLARVLPTSALSSLAPMSATKMASLHKVSTCNDHCDTIVVAHVSQNVTLQGRLLVKDDKDQIVPYGVPEAGIELTFGFQSKGGFVRLSQGSYDTLGNFRIDTLCPSKAAYVGVLRITDPHKHYLSVDIDVAVSPPPATTRELRIGDVTLTTASGRGCKGADLHRALVCFASQRSASRTLDVTLAEALGGRKTRGALHYTIRRGYSHSGKIVAGPSTVRNGHITAKLPVGYYTLEVEGGGYARRAEPVLLDSNRKATVALHATGGQPFRIIMETSSLARESDYDLGLSLRAPDGSECTVSAQNQRCPDMRKTVELGPNGKEYDVIEVTRFVPGTYLAFVGRGERYGTCAQASAVSSPRHLSSGYYAANQAYNIFTSWGWGGAAYAPGLGNAGLGSVATKTAPGLLGGIALAPNSVPHAFLPQVWAQTRALGDVMQSGRVINFPALFSAVKAGSQRGSDPLMVPELSEYFNLIGNAPDRAELFVRALPILYPNDGGALAAGVESLLARQDLGKGITVPIQAGLTSLKSGRFVFDSAAAAALFTAFGAGKTTNALPAQPSADQTLVLPPLTAKEGEAQSKPVRYVPGIGEEPYLLLKNQTSAVEDVEVGIECDPATPLRPLFVPYTDKTLVGVELCDQIGVLAGEERLPACAAQPAKPHDLRGLVPENPRPDLPPHNYTSTFFTELIPNNNTDILQYLKDDVGRLFISFTNGTVIHTDLFEQVKRKETTRSQKMGDALHLDYDDGSSCVMYTNGTAVHVGPRKKYVRRMVPVTAQKTVIVTSWLEAIAEEVSVKTSRKEKLKEKVRAAKTTPVARAEAHLASAAAVVKHAKMKTVKPKKVKVEKVKVTKPPKVKAVKLEKQTPRVELHAAPARVMIDYTTLFCFSGTSPASARSVSSVTQRSPSASVCDQLLSSSQTAIAART